MSKFDYNQFDMTADYDRAILSTLIGQRLIELADLKLKLLHENTGGAATLQEVPKYIFNKELQRYRFDTYKLIRENKKIIKKIDKLIPNLNRYLLLGSIESFVDSEHEDLSLQSIAISLSLLEEVFQTYDSKTKGTLGSVIINIGKLKDQFDRQILMDAFSHEQSLSYEIENKKFNAPVPSGYNRHQIEKLDRFVADEPEIEKQA